MSITLYDTTFSLYCQLARAVMYENGIDFTSRYVDLPNGEQLEPWFARINPKMIIPSVQLDDGTIISDSRNIMKEMDKACPATQQDMVEKIMDIAYSCDLGWLSTVAMKKEIWLWKLIQESGIMEKTVRSNCLKMAKANKDLHDIYIEKMKVSEMDVSAAHNLSRREPVQKCLDSLVEVLMERKEGEWLTGKEFTRADSLVCIYIRWALWQSAWAPDLLSIHPSLKAFYEEVKDRPCIVKTLDVEPNWVGFYWRNRLAPVQKVLTGAALAILAGAAYTYFGEGISA